MKQMLTTKSLDSMPPATTKRYEVRDRKVNGLHVRVSITGAKVFYTMVRPNGSRRRIKIGPYPVVFLVDARRRAMEIARDVELGEFDKTSEVSEASAETLKWSYYLSLLKLDENYNTNHAGLVVFDEPGQQAADPVNLTSLFQESSKIRPDQHQILIATSEKEHAIKEGLGDRPYNLISFNGYILKPLT